MYIFVYYLSIHYYKNELLVPILSTELNSDRFINQNRKEPLAISSSYKQKRKKKRNYKSFRIVRLILQFSTRHFPEKVVPKILGQLCSGNLSPTQHLETQQALVKQLAEILEFVLKFDEHKMKTPAIQNDFSYYRRTLTRASLARQENAEKDLVVGNELANRMSLFYAHATPMLRVLSHATITFLMDVSGIASFLSTIYLFPLSIRCFSAIIDPPGCQSTLFAKNSDVIVFIKTLPFLFSFYAFLIE